MADSNATLVRVAFADSGWYVTVVFWYAAAKLLAYGTYEQYVTDVPL